MKKKYLLLLLLSTFLTTSAQTPEKNGFTVNNMISTSPDAAILSRFGDIPVGHYTGTADITVPIYTLKEGGMEIPIILRYHSSGVKVQDEAGWVGLGWSLEPGGMIIQSVIGREDGYDNLVGHPLDGYDHMKENMLLAEYSEKFDGNLSSDGVMRTFAYAEGQPDYYYFNYPGLSGKFYINPETNEPVIVDKKTPLTIVRNSFNGWTITNIDGTQFIFNEIETASGVAPAELTGKAWRLTRIIFTNGREVNYEYSTGNYYSFSKSQSWHGAYPLGYDTGWPKNYLNSTIQNVKYLKKITTSALTIEFNLEDRDDLFYTADNDGISGNGLLSTKRLKSIELHDPVSNVLLRSFSFAYDYFSYSTIGGNFMFYDVPSDYDKLGKRLKLNSILETGYDSGNAEQSRPYTFFYEESIQLPLKSSYARDFWGYYNGKNNNSLLPNLSYYLFSGYPEYQSVPLSVLSSYGNGGNRSVNIGTVQAGMLKKIGYPTGGYSLFTYESNSFTNFNYPDIDQIANSTVSNNIEDKNNTNDTRSRQFTIPNSLTVHFTISFNRGPNTSLTFTNMLPCYVNITRVGNGGSGITNIKTWQMQSTQAFSDDFNADGMVTWTEDLVLEYVPNTYYVISAQLPDGLGPQNTSTNSASVSAQYNFTYMINTTSKLSNGAGVRIKTIQNYLGSNVLASQKSYVYKQNGVSSGILMAPLKHFYKRKMYFERSTFIGGNCDTDTAYTDIWFVSDDGAIPLSNAAAGNAVGYSKVQEIDLDVNLEGATYDNTANGVHNYYFHNAESKTKPLNPEIPDLRNGQLLQEDFLTATADTVRKIQYFYVEKEAKFFRGFKVFENYVGYDPTMESSPCSYFPDGLRFSINSYPNNAQWFLLDKKISTDYLNGNILRNTVNYSYNSLGQLISAKTYNSLGQELISNYKYPIDDNSSTTAILVMKYLGQYNNILDQWSTVDGTEVFRSRNKYKSYVGFPLPTENVVLESVETSNNGIDFREDVRYLSYGDYKVPTMLLKDGRYTTLIWSYNSLYPVAKIENAEISTINSVLGAQNIIDFMKLPNPSSATINSFLAPLRMSLLLDNSRITTFSYSVMGNLAEEIDFNGRKISYDYDHFQRLRFVRDHDGNIIKSNNYNYRH